MFFRQSLCCIITLVFRSLVLATTDLSSSSFENCGKNATIWVNHAFVGFDRASGIVSFDFSGTSTEEQKVKATLVVLAYGTQVYRRSFDPCDESTKVPQICPVPKGTFSASGNQAVPAQYLNQIPSIAYSIPDLEGNATLTLVSLQNGAQVGCIQVGITNGKSFQMPQVSNAVLSVATSSLALSGVSGLAAASFASGPPSSVGFGTMLGWFQTIAVTGMMSVNYPPVYRSFSKNFAFSTGLVSWKPMQTTLDNFRSRTGGNLTDDNVQFLQTTSLSIDNGGSDNPSLARREATWTSSIHTRKISITSSNSTNVNSSSQASHIVHGIGAFAEELMIPQSNIFMTALLVFATVLLAIAAGILFLKGLLEFWALYGTFPERLAGFRKRYWTLMTKTIANLILLLYGVWVTWCIFQFSLSDSWGVRIIAAVTLTFFTTILLGFAIRIVVLARRYTRHHGDASALYENKETWVKYSVFYDSYKQSKWWIFMPFIFVSFCRGAILAGGNGHGLMQTVAQLAVETMTFLFLLWNRPFATKAGNWINLTIQVVRVLSFVCVLVFVEQLGISQTTKTVTGFILIVVQGVLTGLLIILIAVNALVIMCKENPHRKNRKDAEKRLAGHETLTSLSPHDSFLPRSETHLVIDPKPRSNTFYFDHMRSVPHKCMPSSIPKSMAKYHSRPLSEAAAMAGASKHTASLKDTGRTSLIRNSTPAGARGWHPNERMSITLGRPLDTRQPIFPIM